MKTVRQYGKCKLCKEYSEHYGHGISCEKHREEGTAGFYLVGCRKCDVVLRSTDREDNLCGSCAGEQAQLQELI